MIQYAISEFQIYSNQACVVSSGCLTIEECVYTLLHELLPFPFHNKMNNFVSKLLNYVFVYEEAKELSHVNYIFSLGMKRLKEQKTRNMSVHKQTYPDKTQ